ncbi:MAG: DNA polymerase IV [FCB group bacterium]|nr:DNA polymerase IV [FCB group bacterium]MBL7027164.1 DNA polymerase IV [Candidatus Neomarinimicrobiota bacterium]MBL7120601.1 DNA polymerase IV [Candidatus Neomarinimicrobiota bacterium]
MLNPQPYTNKPRAIIHLDLDAFFCSVEVLRDPSLEGKPVVVGGRSENRGVVAAASYPARKYGIHSAMPMIEASRRCKDLVVISSQHGLYRMYSKVIMGILRNESPIIQQVSIDEAYLDLSDEVNQWIEVTDIARKIQLRISRDIGLSASVGVATNKMIAKIASDFQKPNGLTVVPPGTEIEFLGPLPVKKIPGIGPKANERLAKYGIYTIADMSVIKEDVLKQRFGKLGEAMSRWSKGIDDRPVHEDHETKSISTERTFSKNIEDQTELLEIVEKLSFKVGEQLKKKKFMAATITLKLRYADFTTFTRQHTVMEPLDDGLEIYRIARKLLVKNWMPGEPVRLLGVGGSHFSEPHGQLSLGLDV